MKLLNKKEGKLFSIWWFAVLFITGLGIFLMVYFFYGSPYDIRSLEAHILANKVADCVSYAGRVNSNLISGGVISEGKENFLENCHLNFNAKNYQEDNTDKIESMCKSFCETDNPDFCSSNTLLTKHTFSAFGSCYALSKSEYGISKCETIPCGDNGINEKVDYTDLTKSEGYWTSEQYYAEVNFYKLGNTETSILTLKKGNSDWKADCAIQEGKDYKKLAKCNEGSFYSTDNLNNQYIIKVLTIVRKSEKNVKF